MLGVQRGDSVLEVGCGNGVAVALLAERLTHGTITAIDRSGVMVRRARELNGRHIASGRVRIEQASLEDGSLDGMTFDRILAVNVNAFWTTPEAMLDATTRVLAPDGLLCLVYQPPVTATVSHLARELTRTLAERGFAEPTVAFNDLAPVPALCVKGVRVARTSA